MAAGFRPASVALAMLLAGLATAHGQEAGLVEPGPEAPEADAPFDFAGLDQWRVDCFQGGEEVLSLSPVYRIRGHGRGPDDGGWQYVLPDGRRFVGRVGTNVTCAYTNLTNPIPRDSFESEAELAGIDMRPTRPMDDVPAGVGPLRAGAGIDLSLGGDPNEDRARFTLGGVVAEEIGEQGLGGPEIPGAAARVPRPAYSPSLRTRRGLPDINRVWGDIILTGQVPQEGTVFVLLDAGPGPERPTPLAAVLLASPLPP